jgi:energy-coupling factor transporter ATP-binding protein EcfA2
MNIDQAKETFDRLYPEWVSNKGNIDTEQDARFQIINRILTEVLGWEHKEIKTEPHVDSGFVDYLLMSGDRGRLVVEAKRVDRLLIDTRSPKYATYKASGPALQSARDGLEQAKRYCSDTAAPFAALTTGFEWIGFWALRTDGKPPTDGKALVFPTLETIRDNFAAFYDLFSRDGVLSNRYQVYVHEAEGLHVAHSEVLYHVLEPNEVRLLSKSKLSADLENVFRSFFGTMSGDNDPEMLARCFVESKESREADISLQKITRNLINRIDVVEPGEGSELRDHVKFAVESQRGEFVLIIGNKGAGKSTFIDRFFRMMLGKELRERCLVVRVNLQDSDGRLDTVADWLRSRMIEEVERAFFGEKSPTYDELQGIFFSEYERWRDGEYSHLYQRNKSEFKIKFGEYIANLIEHHPEKYLNRLLRDAVRSRKLMPCLIFDNTDHFPQYFQEAVFQFAQSVHRANFSFVVCPITDRTIWQLHKHGPLQSYETTAFYLPIPSTKEVLEKRVSFLKEKLQSEKGKEKADYFLAKGIRLRLDDLNAFAACIDEVFVQSEYVSRTVGWISNHDIRRSLNIAQRIITSPIVSMEDLVKTYLADGRLTIPRLKIRQALIFGDHNQFRQEANDYVLNLFIVAPDQLTTPLVRLSILRLLMDVEAQSSDAETRYMTVENIGNYLEPCGIPRQFVSSHLKELLKFRLIDPYDPTDIEIYEEQRVRVSHCGHIHLEMALRDDVYLSSMAFTTAVRSMTLVDDIREIRKQKMDRNSWQQIEKLFVEYLLREDEAFVSIPNLDSYDGQVRLRAELRSAWTERPVSAPDVAAWNQ